MIKDITVSGKQEFMGVEVDVVEGGLGKNKRIVTAHMVAEIHGVKVKHINELINNNLEEFEEGLDLLNLLRVGGTNSEINELFNVNIPNNSKNFYILSEQGYIALVSLMRTDKAREIRKKFRREYFSMREELNNTPSISDKDMAILNIFNAQNDVEVAIAVKKLTEIVQAPLVKEIETLTPQANSWKDYMDVDGYITMSNLAKSLNIKGLGRNKMFELLRNKEVLRKNNEPYQRFVDSGYFVVKQGVSQSGFPFTQTFTTSKGMEWISKKLRDWIYIYI